MGIGFDLTDVNLGHLGYYLFTKDDKYFFDATGASEWIDKTITTATLEDPGLRTSDATQLDTIEDALSLATDYFDTGCNTDGGDCTVLLEAIFADGAYGQEADSGADPGDARSTIINNVTSTDYLPSICPNDATTCTYDETDVFAQSFTPGG